MAAFDGWAEYYDLIHDGLPGDADFYVQEARASGGEVLELGVGTGRIAFPMLKAGLHVTGIDDSDSMLALCREKKKALGRTTGRLALVRADMTEFDLRREFPCAVMPYRAFMHLLTPADQQRCLATVRRHLVQGGTLVLDTWAAKPSALAALVRRSASQKPKLAGRYDIPEARAMVLHYHAVTCDEFHQLLIEEHIIQNLDKKGVVRREVKLPLVRAWTTPREMDNLLTLAGFAIEERFGDFSGGPFTPHSTEIVYRLRKTSR